MRKLFGFNLIVFITLLLVACNKDKFQTKPQISVKEIRPGKVISRPPSSNTIPLEIELEYTDKEGDVQDTLFIRKFRKNQRGSNLMLPGALYQGLRLPLPEFPSLRKGIIKYAVTNFSSDLATVYNNENDTIFFKFALKDKQGNVSDTISTETLVVRFN
jgi:hypothetical protein